MVVVVQLAERQIVALEVKGSIPFDHPRIKVCSITLATPFFNGVSPSGKALDSDSNIRWFESSHPSQKDIQKYLSFLGAPERLLGRTNSNLKKLIWFTSSVGRALDF